MTNTLDNLVLMRSKDSVQRIYVLASDTEKSKRAFRRTQLNFLVGDWVVFEGKLYEVKYVYCSEYIRITDGFHGKTIADYMDHLRHATEEEYENRFANM